MSSTRIVGYSTGGIGGRPVLGITIPIPQNPGQGLKGYVAPALVDTDNTYDRYEQPRFTLRQGWNTTYQSQLKSNGQKLICTPFRAVNNSGDLLSRVNYSCSNGTCQSFQSRPQLRGLKTRFGSIQGVCDGTGIQPAACNPKYVYDSSDYIKYKMQSAIAKNYNPLSNGGNDSSASQIAYRAIRRY